MAKVKEHSVIFNKGLNTSLSSVGYDLHPVKMDNCWLSRDDRGGAIEVMPGYSTFHTFADNDVAIQSIGSAGVKTNSFALYALGSTKFYRYLDAPDPGNKSNGNIATKTGLTDGQSGSIFVYGDVDGSPHAWVFNGVDSPFMSEDSLDNYDRDPPYNIDDIGVDRPDASNYAVGDAADRIYVEGGAVEADGLLKHFWLFDWVDGGSGDTYTDDTTDANVVAGLVPLGPAANWKKNKEGHFIASDTAFGGLVYDLDTNGAGGAAYTWKYYNGSGWVNFSSIEDDTSNLTTSGTVSWTVPSEGQWKKNKVPIAGASKKGPYYWAFCTKKSGTGTTSPIANQIEILNQRIGEQDAQGVVKHRISKIEDTAESALSGVIKDVNGVEGIDVGEGGTVKVVIDKGSASDTDSTYYDGAEFKLYRTYQDGAQPYDTNIRITCDDAGAGEAEDNIADNELGNLPYLHGDVPPSTCLPALAHFNRIFAADPSTSRVYWSDLANPESFWTDDNGSYAEIFPGDGDEITALARDREGILVFKHNHLYKLAGRTPDQFYVQEITLADMHAGTVGAPSIRCITYTPSGIVFYYNKAVYLYNGSYPTKISGAIDEDLRAIDSKDEVAGVCIGYYSNRNQIYLSIPTASVLTTGQTYIFDMDVGQWSGRIMAGFRQFLSVKIDADTNVARGVSSETGEFFLGADTEASGKVFQLDDGTDYDGTDIETNFTLSPFFGSSLNALKTFMYVDILFKPVADGLFNMVWWIDDENGDATAVPVAMDKTGYGIHRRRVNIGYKGRSLNLQLKNNASYSGAWKIYGFVIGYIEHESYSL